MKISIISKSLFALALTLSLASFTSEKKEESKKTSEAKNASFDAAIFQLNNTQKVKLAIDKGGDDRMRVSLKDKGGRTLYTEMYHKSQEKYRRVFDLTGMNDGTYYFEMLYKDKKLTKQIDILTNKDRVISFQ